MDPMLFILDVGHGNSAVLSDTHGTVIFDAGPGTSLLEFLKQEQIPKVDVVLISHADRDHIEGLISLIESDTVTIGRVRLNSDLLKASDVWEDLLFLLDEQHSDRKIDFDVALTSRNSGEFDQGDVCIEVLAPSLRLAGTGAGGRDVHGRRLRTNSVSAVFRLSHGGSPVVLFAGDIDESGLDDMIAHGASTLASVLVFPHHGGRSVGDSEEFARRICELVKPQTVIFSIGRGVHSTPNPQVVAAIRRQVPDVRIACTQLSKHCAGDLPSEEGLHVLPHFARGKHTSSCCAGTVTIRFAPAGPILSPDTVGHGQFITNAVPTPLCR